MFRDSLQAEVTDEDERVRIVYGYVVGINGTVYVRVHQEVSLEEMKVEYTITCPIKLIKSSVHMHPTLCNRWRSTSRPESASQSTVGDDPK
jgi:hypothetical protein